MKNKRRKAIIIAVTKGTRNTQILTTNGKIEVFKTVKKAQQALKQITEENPILSFNYNFKIQEVR